MSYTSCMTYTDILVTGAQTEVPNYWCYERVNEYEVPEKLGVTLLLIANTSEV